MEWGFSNGWIFARGLIYLGDGVLQTKLFLLVLYLKMPNKLITGKQTQIIDSDQNY